jgi:hypothetical protein
VEVAVAKHHTGKRWRLESQDLQGVNEVQASSQLGAGAQMGQELVDSERDGGRGGADALHDGGGVDVVDGGHGLGELGGEAGQDAGEVPERGSAVEPGEEWLAGCEIHDRPRVVERSAGRAGEVDGGCGCAGLGQGGLHGDLFRSHLGVGDDPQHNVVRHIGWDPSQAEMQDRRPVAAGQRPWLGCEVDVGP